MISPVRRWMRPAGDVKPPYVAIFRNRFTVAEAAELVFAYSADERVEFFLDGEWLADGPERGDVHRWFLGRARARLAPGHHVLTARLLAFGPLTAYAQQSIRHGLHVDDESCLLASAWETQVYEDCEFLEPFPDWGTYPRVRTGPSFNWRALEGEGGAWLPAEFFTDDRPLHEPALPPMRREEETGFRVVGDRILFDEYACVWTDFVFSGEGEARLRWSETAYRTDVFDPLWLKGDKGKRDGDVLVGEGHVLKLPGGRVRWRDFYWKAGRILEVRCSPGARLESATFHRTGYPLRRTATLEGIDPGLRRVLALAEKTLKACTHETYMDCPYYEQLMYIADSRLEALASYVLAADARPQAKALRIFADGQRADGAMLSQYPAKAPQSIPLFSAVYPLLLHDYALWRDDPDTVAACLPAARRVADFFRAHFRRGLLRTPDWNFIDWLPGWDNGVPPGAENGGATLHGMVVLAMTALAELETHWGGDPEPARAFAGEVRAALRRHFYDDRRGLFAEDRRRRVFSEHAQAMALLDVPAPDLVDRFREARDLAETGIAFSHYYLEACHRHKLADLFDARLARWRRFEHEGLATLPEEFNNPRSDCHAWSAHPLYHAFASMLGVRPAAFGFRAVAVDPLRGAEMPLAGSLPHPKGAVRVRIAGGRVHAEAPAPCRAVVAEPEAVPVGG